MDKKDCTYCGTSMKNIRESGFVGCEHCYFEIEQLNQIAKNLFNGKSFSGRKPYRRNDG